MKKTCHDVLEETGQKEVPLFKLALALEKIALEDPYFVERKLYPNVDFYSGIHMTNVKTQTKTKRGRPPLSAAKKMQRSKAALNARMTQKALRAKIAMLKANFKEKLKIAEQEAYQKALEKVVKIEHKKMEANFKALAVAKAKGNRKRMKRMLTTKGRGRASQLNAKVGTIRIAALWGPAHGGANEACLNMLLEIGDISRINHYIQKAKDPNDPFRLMGFGHRVYKNYDPRASVMKKTCHDVLEETGQKEVPLFKLALALEKIALEDPYFVERKLYPNVDFYSGITLSALGIPTNMFTVIFALARTEANFKALAVAKAKGNRKRMKRMLTTKGRGRASQLNAKVGTIQQEAYQKALEKVVKIEHKKMEANFKALAVAKAKGNRKRMKRMLTTKGRGRASQLNAKVGTIQQEAYQKALEKVVKIEHKKMEANFKALAVAKAKGNRKRMKRMLTTKGRGRASQLNAKVGTIQQEAYQKALEKVVKIEHKKMEANFKALAVAKAKGNRKRMKRMLTTKGRGRASQLNAKVGTIPSGLFAMTVNASPVSQDANVQAELQQLSGRASGLNPKVLQLGLEAYNKARQEGLDNQHILTIIDYTKPSTARRLWVLDLNNNSVLFNEYVAHGQNSGGNYATSFSDRPGSLESSLGVFLTESTYQGKHGYSLKLKGLEKGFNDRAEARDIVVHRADYATAQFAQQHGRLGRSWGCFAVSPAVADSLIHSIKNGTLATPSSQLVLNNSVLFNEYVAHGQNSGGNYATSFSDRPGSLESSLDNQHILTIIDYTKPSTARRLWVLDLNNNSVLFNEYVAHGQNSGGNYATSFSDRPGSLESSLGVFLTESTYQDRPGSLESSLGVFLTESTYQGKHGYSLKLKGLEKGFNDRAEARDIVVHRADYATAQFAQQHGRLGRSWGCFAVSPAVADSLIHSIKNGTLVFAYYPDPSWLSKSQFLS
ncbi:hypothetical protein FQR65_LT17441 [Abscondita terminalis]|nr:hypothetical protein FQR65_LT17441 [Abscondita terminalis]